MEHVSVLLNETIDMLNVKDDGIYVDCTLGRGGHSSAILKRCKNGHLYAIDCDQQAIDESSERLLKIGSNFTCIHNTFENLGNILDSLGIEGVDGILLDLGVSSPQFDDEKRGFSYRMDARLDMRMNQEQELDAWKVVNEYPVSELTRIFKEYGEDPFAYKIACRIEKVREEKPIDTTLELVDVIRSALPEKVLHKKGHPAKRIFQAIRIEVNHELDQLAVVLKEGLKRLNPQGRMVVITFHSLEDRMVKNVFKEVAVPKKVDKRLPELRIEKLDYQLVNRKPVTATNEELNNNNRAHSAKLRGIERIE
ncbi:16S rRNA (cytosine(1402)-N(4))-methyltransferase RsmH [Floccifex sp.]